MPNTTVVLSLSFGLHACIVFISHQTQQANRSTVAAAFECRARTRSPGPGCRCRTGCATAACTPTSRAVYSTPASMHGPQSALRAAFRPLRAERRGTAGWVQQTRHPLFSAAAAAGGGSHYHIAAQRISTALNSSTTRTPPAHSPRHRCYASASITPDGDGWLAAGRGGSFQLPTMPWNAAAAAPLPNASTAPSKPY
eukprot:COSAG05_NODE_1171_length_5626_cov_7.557626_2_plen_197_part_00